METKMEEAEKSKDEMFNQEMRELKAKNDDLEKCKKELESKLVEATKCKNELDDIKKLIENLKWDKNDHNDNEVFKFSYELDTAYILIEQYETDIKLLKLRLKESENKTFSLNSENELQKIENRQLNLDLDSIKVELERFKTLFDEQTLSINDLTNKNTHSQNLLTLTEDDLKMAKSKIEELQKNNFNSVNSGLLFDLIAEINVYKKKFNDLFLKFYSTFINVDPITDSNKSIQTRFNQMFSSTEYIDENDQILDYIDTDKTKGCPFKNCNGKGNSSSGNSHRM